MNHSWPCARFIVALSLGVSACGGIGRPLVDTRDGTRDSELLDDMCLSPPDCNPPDMKPAWAVPFDTGPIPLSNCAPSAGDLSSGPDLYCAELSWPESESESAISRSGFRLTHSNLTLASRIPLTVHLDAAVLYDVWIALEGPVSLSIRSESVLTNVRIHIFPSEGEPRIAFEDSQIAGLTITVDDSTALGLVSATRVTLSGGRLSSREVSLESVTTSELRVEAQRLSITDMQASDNEFAFDEALLASSSFLDSRVSRCGKATFVDASIEGSTFGACDAGKLRFYDSSLRDSFVDGPTESDKTRWSSVRFGALAPTELLAWDSEFGSITLCPETRGVQLAGQTSVTCSTCEGRKAEALTCQQDDRVELEGNACPALEAISTCPAPFPRRARPQSGG